MLEKRVSVGFGEKQISVPILSGHFLAVRSRLNHFPLREDLNPFNKYLGCVRYIGESGCEQSKQHSCPKNKVFQQSRRKNRNVKNRGRSYL